MAQAAIPFPDKLPAGYEWFDDEPEFNPALHLALEKPDEIRYLSEFGYSDEEVQSVASPVAVSSPFRVLSAAGSEVLLQVARKLKQHAISCERIEIWCVAGVIDRGFFAICVSIHR